MEIAAQNDAHFVLFRGNDVDDFEKDFVPERFRVASQDRHVDLVMNVTDSVHEFQSLDTRGFSLLSRILLFFVFVRVDAEFPFVFEIAFAVPFYYIQSLCIFADARRAVQDQILEFRKVGESFDRVH
jgi:hypothetical protein